MNPHIWKNKKVLVTGYNGFKGTWLTLCLQRLGANVSGIALAPRDMLNHWDLMQPQIREYRTDLRDPAAVARVIESEQPEIIFHLAAQALVRRSYRDPLETWSTNVMGAANLFEACRKTKSVKSIVCITSDKCYENVEQEEGYVEDDRLGGIDPYSASKAAVEICAASYGRAFFKDAGILLATTRAGNVIGGGDWSEDRLIPDVVRAATTGETLKIRSPRATRPWQHVLEPVCGYILLGEKLLQRDASFEGAWNFGPDDETNQPVSVMLDIMKILWPVVKWELDGVQGPYESTLLHLDSTKARERLGWAPVWNLDHTLQATAEWYRSFYEKHTLVTEGQIERYINEAREQNITWTKAA